MFTKHYMNIKYIERNLKLICEGQFRLTVSPCNKAEQCLTCVTGVENNREAFGGVREPPEMKRGLVLIWQTTTKWTVAKLACGSRGGKLAHSYDLSLLEDCVW